MLFPQKAYILARAFEFYCDRHCQLLYESLYEISVIGEVAVVWLKCNF